MESQQKHLTIPQMMSLIQEELVFNDSAGGKIAGNTAMGNYGGTFRAWLLDTQDAEGISRMNMGQIEEEEVGNYSGNTTSLLFPDPSGSVPTPPEDSYVPYSMRPETYIIPVLFAIIFIIGVIGNGTLIVIFLKHRSMRNVPNM